MIQPVNLFIATSLVLLFVYKVVAIVRESIVEAAPGGDRGAASVFDAALRASGRMLVLFGTALAISCAITVTRYAV